MEAVIVNYRRGKRTQNTRQMVVKIKGAKTKADAEKYVGKTIEWTTQTGRKVEGKVTKAHGGTGSVLARFEPALPGQAIGTKAKIV